MKFEEIVEKIFQSYDVRGIYPDEYDGDIAYRIGRAVVALTKAKRVILGRDMRRGGHALLSALAVGMVDQGANVTDAGMCSSDALYFGGWNGKYDLSLMVTASHNPAKFNGTKFVKKDGISLGKETGLYDVKRMVLKNDFPKPRRRGNIDRVEVMKPFVRHALSFINRKKLKPFKIVVDAGNGMGGELINILQNSVPFKIIPMFFEPDGSFPNHDADPTRPECVEILRKRVIKEKADLGLGFDGDADRAALIDEKGNLLNGSELGSVIARKILEDHPGAKIGHCLVSSWIARDTVLENGGQVVVTPVGGANIRPVMQAEDVLFVSERSGHFYMKANNYADSGLIAALIALEQLSAAGCTLSELIQPYKRYFMAPELSLVLGSDSSTKAELDKLKQEKMKKIADLAKGAAVVHRNEDRYEFGNDWWFCVRPSGTEPRKLRITVEAKSKELLEEKYAELARLFTT